MALLSIFTLLPRPAFPSLDITMYLVLSAFTSNPISLVTATRASAFSFTVCTPFLYWDYIQNVSQLVGITAGVDFLGICDKKSSYKHVSDFGRLRRYGRFLIS